MCLRPLTRKIENHGFTRIVTHPCGKCLECVAQLQNDWANRMSDEFKNWKHAYFGTFTYGNSCIPYVDVIPSELPAEKLAYLVQAINKIPQSASLAKARAAVMRFRIILLLNRLKSCLFVCLTCLNMIYSAL